MPKRARKQVQKSADEEKDEDVHTVTVNEDFAKSYDERKRRELLSTLDPSTRQQLEGDDDDASSSDDEEEDDFGELLTKKVDAQIQRTLHALRTKDPAIYDSKTVYFPGSRNDVDDDDEGGNEEEAEGSESDASSGDEPVAGWDTIAKAAEAAAPKLTIKDYVRETLLKEGEIPDSDEERFIKRRHVEEENEEVVRNKTTLHDASDSDDESSDGEEESGFEAEQGTKKAKESGSGDDEDENSENDSDEKNDSGEENYDFFTLKKKSKKELEREEQDFKKWSEDLAAKKSSKRGGETSLHSYLETETQAEKDRFLREYVMSNGWLESDDRAAGGSDYVVEKELHGVVEKSGVANEDDFDADDEYEDEFDEKVDAFEAEYNFRFEDPNAAKITPHARVIPSSMRRPDERRKKARSARKERKDKEKLLKTEEIKQLKNVKKKEIQSRLLALQDAAGAGVDLSAFDLDADFDPDEFSRQMEAQFNDEYYGQEDAELQARMEEKDNSRPDAEEIINKAEPEAGVKNAVEQLMDEYYNLDYEDIVGGVPVRFKYKEVDREDFGMTPEEILAEEDKELNRRASLKFLAPYRDRKDVKKRAKTAKWKARYGKDAWKRKIPTRDGAGPSNGKKRQRGNDEEEVGGDGAQEDTEENLVEGNRKKKSSAAGAKRKRDEDVDMKGEEEVVKKPKNRKKRRHGKVVSVKNEDVEQVEESNKERRKNKVLEGMSAKRLAAYYIST